jgi:XTP/dITP diphosphohydrolase
MADKFDTIIFATHNEYKLMEIKPLLSGLFNLKTLDEAGIPEEIPETGNTLEENAILKARYVFDKTDEQNCFADDTGLEVEALDGAPGVYSARYAGRHGDSDANISKLLSEMEGIENRNARFRTVIALILEGQLFTFEGVVKGKITTSPIGSGGFGYDPVFQPENLDQTFGQMCMEEKNLFSHRAMAVAELVSFLHSMK